MYPILRFKKIPKSKGSKIICRRINVVFIDERGNQLGRSMKINKLIESCNFTWTRKMLVLYNQDRARYLHRLKCGELLVPIYYSDDPEGREIIKFYDADYNPLILESDYISSTFKRSK